MKVNIQLLEKKILESGMTIEDFSKNMGISPSTYYRKREKGCLTFSVGQMHSIVEILGLSMEEANNIFLAKNSH